MTSITVEWLQPDDDGATPITDYEVQMDDGTGVGFVSIGSTGDGLITEFTEEGLTPG